MLRRDREPTPEALAAALVAATVLAFCGLAHLVADLSSALARLV